MTGLTASGAVDARGHEHGLDLIVLATGFDASNYLGSFTVKGLNGIELHEQWNGEPQALLGLMTPNFPNFFMLYGPNTNSVPLVSFYQAQARFAAPGDRQARPHRPPRGPRLRAPDRPLQQMAAEAPGAHSVGRDAQLLPGPDRPDRLAMAFQRQLLHRRHPCGSPHRPQLPVT